MTDVVIRAFQAVDQVETKALIEAGLKERFDPYLEDYNLDLNDLERYHLTMFVAIVDDQIAACGGLTLASETTVRITRMSTKLEFRGRGLAKLILERLIFEAQDRGFSRLKIVVFRVCCSKQTRIGQMRYGCTNGLAFARFAISFSTLPSS